MGEAHTHPPLINIALPLRTLPRNSRSSFHPRDAMTTNNHETVDAVSVSVPGRGRLAGDYQAGRTAGGFAVVWVHGFGSHRGGEKAAAVRAECGRRGWAFAAFDFHGHGASDGAMHELRASGLIA